MKSLLKKIAATLLGPYEFYSIYRTAYQADTNSLAEETVYSLDLHTIEASPYDDIRQLGAYAASEALFFGLDDDGELSAACCFWYGETYREKRGFIDLPPGAAKLVHICTTPSKRGKHLATRLIAGATQQMAKRGMAPLYARIWAGHIASEKAFENAGWRKTGKIFKFDMFGRKWTLRL